MILGMHKVDLFAALSYIASGGLAAAAVGFAALDPTYHVQIMAWSAIATGVAGLLVRLWKNPTT